MKKKVLLVGLGPHSKRIYVKYFKEHNVSFSVLVELESKANQSREYLDINNFKNTIIFTIPDEYKDYEDLPEEYAQKLLDLCIKKKIDKIMLSTEPKAHNMYLKFALENNIDILSDKPIIVLKNMNKLESIEKMRNQYYDLLNLYKNSNSQCKIMCQRLYHKGYIYIKQLLKDIVKKYNVPITYIDIYHCDGNWEFPHDLDKENHPYKYGYGKLYHSGFHFIDLLSELLKINNYASSDKRIVNGKLYGNVFTPNDEKIIFNKENFHQLFPETKSNVLYNHLDKIDFNDYGEKNFYSQMNFYNKDKALITTANLNLLHYGFSRRGWFESRDYYKRNGRVRHEKVTINVGPLMNIQITSCQSKEIGERNNCVEELMEGGLEHFDIDIYRNVDIIGGEPHKKIRLYDLYKDTEIKDSFIGFNEKSREAYLDAFINNNDLVGDLSSEKLGIEILYSASKVLYYKDNDIDEVIDIRIPSEKNDDWRKEKNE